MLEKILKQLLLLLLLLLYALRLTRNYEIFVTIHRSSFVKSGNLRSFVFHHSHRCHRFLNRSRVSSIRQIRGRERRKRNLKLDSPFTLSRDERLAARNKTKPQFCLRIYSLVRFASPRFGNILICI